jgi:hypothetical protein
MSSRSVLQPTVALSTVEAAYMAVAAAAREALWMHMLLIDLGLADGAPRIFVRQPERIGIGAKTCGVTAV